MVLTNLTCELHPEIKGAETNLRQKCLECRDANYKIQSKLFKKFQNTAIKITLTFFRMELLPPLMTAPQLGLAFTQKGETKRDPLEVKIF